MKAGDKVEWISESEAGITKGRVYEVSQRFGHLVTFFDDDGDERDRSSEEFRLVPQRPIRTQTKRILAPGVYGPFEVGTYNDMLHVKLTANYFTQSGLDHLALVAAQLAEAFRSLEKK